MKLFKCVRLIRIAKGFRLLKLLTVFEKYKIALFVRREFQEIFFKIILCIPNIVNLIPILVSIFYIYSIIGMV